jgi:serine/threonine protein kinase
MLDWMGHVKLVDFGLSKKVNSKRTRTYSFVGSEGYASPEMMSKKPHNYLTDIYSIGVVLYDMLHGSPPFTKFDPISRTFKLDLDQGNVLKIRKSLSESCRKLLYRLLSKDPDHRLGVCGRTIDLLDDAWFTPARDSIRHRSQMDMPFTPALSDNVLQMEQNESILGQVLIDICGRFI